MCFVDLERRYVRQVDTLSVLPRGRTGLGPDNDAGHTAFADPKLALDFEYRPGERVLTFAAPGIRNASENALIRDGRIHKLDQVEFRMDTSDYGKPWRFTSSDGRFEMDFEPAVDRFSRTNLAVIRSVQHQVFGYFTGTAVLDDGETIRVQRFPGFAEDVLNLW